MVVEDVRREHVVYWALKLGRAELARRCGYQDTIYINQLVKGHGSFGSKTARKLEAAVGVSEGTFDVPRDSEDLDSKIMGKMNRLDESQKKLAEMYLDALLREK